MVNSMEGSKSEDDEVEYEVERILAQYNTDGKTLYLVKWVGYSDERCTWEPYESFLNPQTLTEWRQQLAQGDTLDEEDVAALQDRMDAYVKAQEDNSLHQEEMEERPILVSVGQRSPFSSRNGNVQAESEETLTSHGVRRRSEPLSQPDYALVKRRRPSETFPMTSTTKRPRPESASINKSSLGQGDTIVAQTPGRASTNTTARRTQYRAGDQFKNLRHQNNYVKLARQEPAPDMSRIERRAPDDWMRRGSQICPQTQGNVSPKDQDNDQWLFVPDERNGAKAADKGALLSTQDGSRGESPVCLLARHHDKDASSRTTPPVSELGTRAHDTSHDTSLSTRTIAARNGRTWRHGDVVVHLLFGDHAVGDVKILHLPPWLRVKMLALKQPFEQTLNVHFLERNVLSVEAFSALARNVRPDLWD
ncbi:hypothetical protein A1O3_08325 [Capronia epimyces CBS 606.96]|uniref:Chromo domain-containing protein n=1 Tax=Capronia epimyces CBS 606.96 TaxID=1182542 RepID=W9YCH6_9EURO|nr:uncharacterized protein A1O3_08325 [Capronia epimyces CBS 606.96]EXJ80039.1 hypothetical protein A1O3_08325 [Capronia epimyces CBS 606.96]